MIDLNFYPDEHPEAIAAIPYLVAGYDLSGFTFDSLVECIVDGRLMLWDLMYGVDDDGEIYRRDSKAMVEWLERRK